MSMSQASSKPLRRRDSLASRQNRYGYRFIAPWLIGLFAFTLIPMLFSLVLSFFVPPMFTAIAFDSGGVASGPMTATFLLPLAMGVCSAVGGDIATDAFGIVAMVAMTPLITIQILGVMFRIKTGAGIKANEAETIVEDIIEMEGDA